MSETYDGQCLSCSITCAPCIKTAPQVSQRQNVPCNAPSLQESQTLDICLIQILLRRRDRRAIHGISLPACHHSPSHTHSQQSLNLPTKTPKLSPINMCELLVIRYKGCPHPDHLPGKLHDMPIYCANLEFIEAGTSSTHDVCQLCRIFLKKVGDGKGDVEARRSEDVVPSKGENEDGNGKST